MSKIKRKFGIYLEEYLEDLLWRIWDSQKIHTAEECHQYMKEEFYATKEEYLEIIIAIQKYLADTAQTFEDKLYNAQLDILYSERKHHAEDFFREKWSWISESPFPLEIKGSIRDLRSQLGLLRIRESNFLFREEARKNGEDFYAAHKASILPILDINRALEEDYIKAEIAKMEELLASHPEIHREAPSLPRYFERLEKQDISWIDEEDFLSSLPKDVRELLEEAPREPDYFSKEASKHPGKGNRIKDRDRVPLLENYRPEQKNSSLSEASDEKTNRSRRNRFIAYRCCTKDIMIAAWAARLNKRGLIYEVALFLAEDHWSLAEDSSVTTGIMMMLAHAYCLTGTMRVVFCGPKTGQKATPKTGYESSVPESIRYFTHKNNINLENKAEISDLEGRELFLKITGFSKYILDKLSELQVDSVTTAFLVHRGIWKRDEIELFLNHCISPQKIITGQLEPSHTLHWQAEMTTLRRGILIRRAKSFFALELDGEEEWIDHKWTNETTTEFTFKKACKITPIIGNPLSVNSNETLTIIPIARTHMEYELFSRHDFRDRKSKNRTIIVMTYDFDLISDGVFQKIEQLVSNKNLVVCQVTDTLGAIDIEIQGNLQKSSNFRLLMEDQPDD